MVKHGYIGRPVPVGSGFLSQVLNAPTESVADVDQFEVEQAKILIDGQISGLRDYLTVGVNEEHAADAASAYSALFKFRQESHPTGESIFHTLPPTETQQATITAAIRDLVAAGQAESSFARLKHLGVYVSEGEVKGISTGFYLPSRGMLMLLRGVVDQANDEAGKRALRMLLSHEAGHSLDFDGRDVSYSQMSDLFRLDATGMDISDATNPSAPQTLHLDGSAGDVLREMIEAYQRLDSDS